jgi:hypothetical protein
MSARRRNERYQAFDELASFHQDVGGTVPPAGLEAQRERPLGAFFESVARERRAGDVAAQSLEPSAVSRRYGHLRVEAHSTVLRHSSGRLGVQVGLPGLDAIAEPAPWLTAVRTGGDAGSKRCCRQQRHEGLVAGKGILIVSGAFLEQPPETACRARQHSRHLVGVRRGQGKKARRLASPRRVGVGTVQREGVEMKVQVERRAKALDEGDGATLLRSEVPVPS